MELFRQDLKKYVAKSASLEAENLALRLELDSAKEHQEAKAKLHEKELRALKSQYLLELQSAKNNWRKQAVFYGQQQRLLGMADRLLVDVDEDVNDGCGIAVTALRDDLVISNALLASSDYTVALVDFDVADNHIGLVNGTGDVDINLKGCYITFHYCKERYTIEEDVILRPRSKCSIWWSGGTVATASDLEHHYTNQQHSPSPMTNNNNNNSSSSSSSSSSAKAASRISQSTPPPVAHHHPSPAHVRHHHYNEPVTVVHSHHHRRGHHHHHGHHVQQHSNSAGGDLLSVHRHCPEQLSLYWERYPTAIIHVKQEHNPGSHFAAAHATSSATPIIVPIMSVHEKARLYDSSDRFICELSATNQLMYANYYHYNAFHYCNDQNDKPAGADKEETSNREASSDFVDGAYSSLASREEAGEASAIKKGRRSLSPLRSTGKGGRRNAKAASTSEDNAAKETETPLQSAKSEGCTLEDIVHAYCATTSHHSHYTRLNTQLSRYIEESDMLLIDYAANILANCNRYSKRNTGSLVLRTCTGGAAQIDTASPVGYRGPCIANMQSHTIDVDELLQHRTVYLCNGSKQHVATLPPRTSMQLIYINSTVTSVALTGSTSEGLNQVGSLDGNGNPNNDETGQGIISANTIRQTTVLRAIDRNVSVFVNDYDGDRSSTAGTAVFRSISSYSTYSSTDTESNDSYAASDNCGDQSINILPGGIVALTPPRPPTASEAQFTSTLGKLSVQGQSESSISEVIGRSGSSESSDVVSSARKRKVDAAAKQSTVPARVNKRATIKPVGSGSSADVPASIPHSGRTVPGAAQPNSVVAVSSLQALFDSLQHASNNVRYSTTVFVNSGASVSSSNAFAEVNCYATAGVSSSPSKEPTHSSPSCSRGKEHGQHHISSQSADCDRSRIPIAYLCIVDFHNNILATSLIVKHVQSSVVREQTEAHVRKTAGGHAGIRRQFNHTFENGNESASSCTIC